MIAESFWTLFRDPGHWAFELFLIAVLDGVIGALVWPRIKRHIHRDDDYVTTQSRMGVEVELDALRTEVRALVDDLAATQGFTRAKDGGGFPSGPGVLVQGYPSDEASPEELKLYGGDGEVEVTDIPGNPVPLSEAETAWAREMQRTIYKLEDPDPDYFGDV